MHGDDLTRASDELHTKCAPEPYFRRGHFSSHSSCSHFVGRLHRCLVRQPSCCSCDGERGPGDNDSNDRMRRRVVAGDAERRKDGKGKRGKAPIWVAHLARQSGPLKLCCFARFGAMCARQRRTSGRPRRSRAPGQTDEQTGRISEQQ